MVELITQPKDSQLCGHACLAMLASISLDKAVEVVGHKKGTKTKELVGALRVLGFNSATRLKPGIPKTDEVAILKMVPRKGHKGCWHWILWVRGKIYDPLPGNQSHCIISSFLKVENKT